MKTLSYICLEKFNSIETMIEATTINRTLPKEKLLKAADILKAVAHPVRLAILDLLNQEGGMSVNEICTVLNCEQSLLSHHLINMKLRGILQSNKEGLNVYYTLKDRKVVNILRCIENCECWLE